MKKIQPTSLTKVRNHILVFLVLTLATVSTEISFVHAQQTPQFSQYLVNPMVLNPAIAGAERYFDITLSYRNQWTGFEGAPKTGALTFNVPLPILTGGKREDLDNSHSGVGGYLYSDTAGPVKHSAFYASYAYHLKVSKEWFVSLGTFVGQTQFNFDNTDVVFVESAVDPLNQPITSSNFDASLGMYVYSNAFFAGIAAHQLFENDITDSDIRTGKLNRNYNFVLGGRIAMNEKTQFVPSVLLKAATNTPIQWDLNSKFVYQQRIWAGASYRHQEGIYILGGISLWDHFSFGYSYDFPVSKLLGRQSGSHEIILSYRFPSARGKLCSCPEYSL